MWYGTLYGISRKKTEIKGSKALRTLVNNYKSIYCHEYTYLWI